MFESITRAVKAHKHLAIAAIAVTVLVSYSLPSNMVASAQNFLFPPTDNLPVIINRNIEIPCLPYCNPANEPEDVDVDVDDILHLHIGFSFVPA
jgi:hypothetical protein